VSSDAEVVAEWLARAYVWIVGGLFLGIYLWHIYVFETTGVDIFQQPLIVAFNDYPEVSVPLTFGVLVAGLLLAWRQYRRSGTSGIKPSHAVLLVIALAIFGFAKLSA
jgi:hypothetical protein